MQELVRLVPQPGVDGQSITTLAFEQGWDLDAVLDAEPEAGTLAEKVFCAPRQAWVRFVEDPELDLSFIVVEGKKKAVDAAVDTLKRGLPIYTERGLRALSRAASPAARAHAAVRFGVLALSGLTKTSLDALLEALADRDLRVRKAALAAASYCEAEPLRAAIEQLALRDKSREVRSQASVLVAAYKRRSRQAFARSPRRA